MNRLCLLPVVFFSCQTVRETVPPPVVASPGPARIVQPPEPAPAVTPDAPFRASAPLPSGTVTFTPPVLAERKLKGGLRVVFLERRGLPIVHVGVVMNRGAGDDGVTAPWVHAMASELMERGTKTMSAEAIADGYRSLGAQHDIWVGWDGAGASVTAVTSAVSDAVGILAKTLQEPTFPADEVEKLKKKRIGALAFIKKRPDSMANAAKDVALFGRGDAYGKTFIANEKQIESVTVKDIQAAAARLFTADRATLVVVGDVSIDAFLPTLEKHFGAWKTRAPASLGKHTRAASAAKVMLAPLPKAAQAVVYIAQDGIAYTSPDRVPLAVMNAVLGGIFSSRINMNLRERQSISYGAGSVLWAPHRPGAIYAGGSVTAEKAGAAVSALFDEVRGLTTRPPEQQELDEAKAAVQRGLTAQFESINGTGGAIRTLVIQGLPLTEYPRLLAAVEAVTLADVQRVASTHLQPDTMKVVAAGDESILRPQLEALGLGPVELRDAFGDAVK
jgi:zinc protease